MPFLATLIKRMGFDATTKSARWIQDWFSHSFYICRASLRTGESDTRAIMLEHLLKSLDKAQLSGQSNEDHDVISEFHDHGVAGAETTNH